MAVETDNAPLGAELVEWHWLRPHHQRDALWVVSAGLDLSDVGDALSRDDVKQVQSWLNDQRLHKPEEAELERWEEDSTRQLRMLIIQPFVLVQEPVEGES